MAKIKPKTIKKAPKTKELDEYIGRLIAVIKFTYNVNNASEKRRILRDFKEMVESQEKDIEKVYHLMFTKIKN